MAARASSEGRMGQGRQVTVPPHVPGAGGGAADQSRGHNDWGRHRTSGVVYYLLKHSL